MFVLTALKNILSRVMLVNVKFCVPFSFNRQPKWRHTFRECQTSTRQTWGFVWSAELFQQISLLPAPQFLSRLILGCFWGVFGCLQITILSLVFSKTSVSKYHVTQTLCNHNHIIIIWAPSGWLLRLSLRLRMCFHVLLYSVTFWWKFDVPTIVL